MALGSTGCAQRDKGPVLPPAEEAEDYKQFWALFQAPEIEQLYIVGSFNSWMPIPVSVEVGWDFYLAIVVPAVGPASACLHKSSNSFSDAQSRSNNTYGYFAFTNSFARLFLSYSSSSNPKISTARRPLSWPRNRKRSWRGRTMSPTSENWGTIGS